LPDVADRKAWRQIANWSGDCEEAYSATNAGSSSGLRLHPLGGGKSLLEVICATGAYQGSQEYFVVGGADKAQPLKFVTYEASGPDGETLVKKDAMELTGLAEFDGARRELTVLNRYRGPGDCGSRAVYEIAPNKTTLKEFRAKVQCDGEGAEHPEQWPVVALE
jgi:hypothetical protein